MSEPIPPHDHECKFGDAVWLSGSTSDAHDSVLKRVVAGFEVLGYPAIETGFMSVSDLVVLKPEGKVLLVEVKTRKDRHTGGLSAHQRTVREWAMRSGHPWVTLWVIGVGRWEPPDGKVRMYVPPNETKILGDPPDRELVEKAWLEGRKEFKDDAPQAPTT